MDNNVLDESLVFLVDEEGDKRLNTAVQHPFQPLQPPQQNNHHPYHHHHHPYQQQEQQEQQHQEAVSRPLHVPALQGASYSDPPPPPPPPPHSPGYRYLCGGEISGLAAEVETGPEIGSDSAMAQPPYPFLDTLPAAADNSWNPPQQTISNTGVDKNVATIEEFFIKNGAYRPSVPCNHCRRLRLQCLVLQTTSANPNPILACSSCVALFRDCSLAERGKRQPSAFETPLPVIGHLHGVCEEGDAGHAGHAGNVVANGEQQLQNPQGPMPTATASGSLTSSYTHRRNNTRSVKKTRVLRNWFAAHLNHPYPSEEEKTLLAGQSGLSKIQVINWFANARRRHRLTAQSHLNNGGRHFVQGSPMPQSLWTGLSPMERWKHSPPDEEPVSASAIENAISNQSGGSSYMQPFGTYPADGQQSSASGESGLYNPSMFQDASSNSGSSNFSFYHSDDPGFFSFSAPSSLHGDQDPWPSINATATTSASHKKSHIFQCTFCLQGFKKKYDWVRHERSIHLPGLDSWVCRLPVANDQSCLVWRINQGVPECIFCGQSSPTDEHIQSHEFQACAERPVSERTFTRKDHLWQHLHKFHRCRRWDGWKPNLNLLQHRQDTLDSQCGFCQLSMQSWEERVQHLATHFRHGATMAEWTGGSGIKDGEGGVVAANKQRGESQSSDDAGSSLSLFPDGYSGGTWP